jgi:hypothetical protein
VHVDGTLYGIRGILVPKWLEKVHMREEIVGMAEGATHEETV